jgi:hypothetical protein
MQPPYFVRQTSFGRPATRSRRKRRKEIRKNWVSQKQGNQESRAYHHAKITTRRKSSEWSALEKPVAPPPSPPPCRNRYLELAKGFEPPTP